MLDILAKGIIDLPPWLWVGGLLALLLVVNLRMWWVQSTVVASLKAASAEVRSLNAAKPMRGSELTESLVNAIRADRVEVKGMPGHVLMRPLEPVLVEIADRSLTESRAFAIGPYFTGLALLVTFGLIGLVLTYPIKAAITDFKQDVELANAVGLLGSKFFVSAVGLFCMMAHAAVARWFRSSVTDEARRVARGISSNCVPREVATLRAQLETATSSTATSKSSEALENAMFESKVAISSDLTLLRDEMRSSVRQLEGSIGKLASIEVSVKDMGAEVSKHLGDLMRDELGKQLCDMLAQVMASTDEVATRIEKNLSGAVSETLGRELTLVRESLGAIQKSVEGQASSEVGKLLEQLGTAVSGGFQSESANMATALQRFAEVVPSLEVQLRDATSRMGTEMEKSSIERDAQSKLLLDRLTSVLEGLDAQRVANDAAVEQIRVASAEGAERMAQRATAAGTDMMTQILGASGNKLNEILAALEASAQNSSASSEQIERRIAQAAAGLGQSTTQLVAASKEVATMAGDVRRVLEASGQAVQALQSAAKTNAATTEALRGNLEIAAKTGQLMKEQIVAQQQLQKEQREFAEKLQATWPKLFDTYLTSFKAHSDELATSWRSLNDQVRAYTSDAGNRFSNGVGELADSVDQLKKVLEVARPPAART